MSEEFADGAIPTSEVVRAAALSGFDPTLILSGEPPFNVSSATPSALAFLQALPSSRTSISRFVSSEQLNNLALRDIVPSALADDLYEACTRVVATGQRERHRFDMPTEPSVMTVEYAISWVGNDLMLVIRRPRVLTAVSESSAATDALTGIGTRSTIRQAIEVCLDVLAQGGQGFSLVFLDIDGLKGINDTFGHPVGDAVLGEIGRRLRLLVRGSDAVGRLGGDEFVVIWPGIHTAADLRRLYGRLLRALERPIETFGTTMRVSASAGAVIVVEPQQRDPDDLLRDADAAMYEAKASRSGSLVIFEPTMKTAVLGSLVTAGELLAGVREHQLELFCQPVMDVVSGRTAGAELLLRWRHPLRGLLAPGDFLAAADASDVMADVGEWVVNQAVMTAARWERQNNGLDYFRLGINISPRQLLRTHLVKLFANALDEHGTSADNFVFEVVESQHLDATSRAAEQVRSLRDMGARVAIDDFGKGFANLANLRDLPVDLIKVDRSLIGLYPTPREQAILQAVQGLAQAVGAQVVLEGVERLAQLQVARQCGVQFAQGFLLGMPQPAAHEPPAALVPEGYAVNAD